MKAIGYARVSTEMQAESGLGIAAQRSAISALAVQHELELVDIVVEDESAKDTNREHFQACLEALREGRAQALVAHKFDRVSRSVRDGADLVELFRRNGWRLILGDLGIDTSTPAGELLANMLASVAQWERRMIGVRTSEAMANLPRALRGAAPYGQRRNGLELEDDPAELAIIAIARRHKARGLSLRAIANELNKAKLFNRRGRDWTPQRLHTLLRHLR